MDAKTRSDLIHLVQRDALRTGGSFRLASGRESTYYLDCRKITLSSEGAHVVATAICSTIRHRKVDAIGGLTMGADPIVGAVLAVSNAIRTQPLNGFLVRKEAKGHGTQRLVEGTLKKGDRAVIVEDVTTTGESAMRAARTVMNMGATVDMIISVVDRMEGADEVFASHGLVFAPLLRITELGITLPSLEPAQAAG